MAKSDFLSVSVATTAASQKMYEEIKKQLEKMSTAEMSRVFMGLPRASGKTSAAAAMSSFTGLRAALMAHPPADPWKFGTVHRNKTTDERVMAIGNRKVISLDKRGFGPWNVTPIAEGWFDDWEVEFEEAK